jgi:hypothetical protein
LLFILFSFLSYLEIKGKILFECLPKARFLTIEALLFDPRRRMNRFIVVNLGRNRQSQILFALVLLSSLL